MIHRHSGLVFTEHTLTVPLDHADPDGPQIEIFAREVTAADRSAVDRPFLLYLQGGPGHRAPRRLPVWLRRAAAEYRVVLLDQRGTGRSSPATRQTLGHLKDPTAHLLNFRADSIVADAEQLRVHLAGDRPWSVLGQSFGGFCAITYLSQAPEGLSEVMVAGGLPPLRASPEAIYRAIYPRVLEQNERFFERYPEDRKIAARVADILRDQKVTLPDGQRLTAHRFQSLGIRFGHAEGLDGLHHLLEEAFVSTSLVNTASVNTAIDNTACTELSEVFLHRLHAALSFAEHPLYALMHESIYCQGVPSAWAAHRVRGEFPEFDLAAGGPFCFTGEMIYPWLFSEDPALIPLAECAEQLAHHPDWPPLYDLDRLAANTVPVAAAIYFDDMYVDRDASLSTAAAIGGLRPWITNEYVHDGLGHDAAVFDRLITLVRQ